MTSKVNVPDLAWYVLRITYNRALKCKENLDKMEIKNFIPMHYVMVVKGDRKKRKLVPVVQNLIFVYTTKSILEHIKQHTDMSSFVRYMMDKATGKPMTVPDKQMHDFITIAGSNDEQVMYLSAAEISLKKGDKVRITKGIWAGIEGEFIRIKGDRRVVVIIQGIIAVATVFIHPSWLEPC
ncbi:MAG: UpxY family transcription antiterminator [Tannerella sp.]|jgi:transcription antitermination factor NusG|nr:UpxY family transcription antiterminator [Tannerella sp.]